MLNLTQHMQRCVARATAAKEAKAREEYYWAARRGAMAAATIVLFSISSTAAAVLSEARSVALGRWRSR